MQDPLLSQEVLLGWTVARLKTALDQRPDDLVAFPVPRGPKARSYMPVLVGLGIPRNAESRGREELIKHMVKISAQAQILSDGILPGRRWTTVQAESRPGLLARRTPSGSSRRRRTRSERCSIGIGAERGNFNKIYRDTFTRIVRNGESIPTVLREQEQLLDQVFVKTNAPAGRPIRRAGKRGAGSSSTRGL